MSETLMPALRMDWSADGSTLIAHFDPLGQPCPLDRESLLAAIASAGGAELQRLDEALDRFAAMARDAAQPFFLEVAKRRPGRFEIAVSDDAMTAWLTLHPPQGGAPVSHEQLMQGLADLGVVSGLLEADIATALADGSAQRRVIARGRPAVSGAPSRFQSLLPSLQRRGPRLNDRGVADYRELSSLLIVKAGDPLMRRTPATPGISGEDVFGLVIPAQAGVDTPYSAAASGVSVQPEDPELLVAAMAGQPVLLSDGVSVEPTISLAQVDLESGNVDFDGTVNVAGDVAAGMRIRASGDVHIGGTVEAAEVESGGNIVIGGGAIGHADRRSATSSTRLRARGSIAVQFCENAIIESGSDVLIDEVAIHCEITALQQVLIGKPGGRKSQLIGGHVRASELLRVGVLGSNGGIRTLVQVGFHPHIHAEHAKAEAQLAAQTARQEDLKKLLTLPDEPGRDRASMREKARRTLESSQIEQARLQAFVDELQATLVVIESARVEVEQAVHPGVEVQIGSRIWRCSDTLPAGVLRLQEDTVMHLAK